MNNKEKFLRLVKDEDTDFVNKLQWNKQNRSWLKKSQIISMKVLRILKSQNIRQKELASKIGVSPQQINKWLKGKENFTLETIDKLENALGEQLVFFETNVPAYESIIPASYTATIMVHDIQGQYRKKTDWDQCSTKAIGNVTLKSEENWKKIEIVNN